MYGVQTIINKCIQFICIVRSSSCVNNHRCPNKRCTLRNDVFYRLLGAGWIGKQWNVLYIWRQKRCNMKSYRQTALYCNKKLGVAVGSWHSQKKRYLEMPCKPYPRNLDQPHRCKTDNHECCLISWIYQRDIYYLRTLVVSAISSTLAACH